MAGLCRGQRCSSAPRFVPHDELLTNLGCKVGENGWVATDPTGATSVAGVWAAGNVVDSPAQVITAVITAAGAGTVAAIAINHYLLEEDIKHAVAKYHTAGNALSNVTEQRVAEGVLGDPSP